MKRLSHIDWLRGLAVVIMIEAHTIDAWTVSDALIRAQPRFKLLQFLAGWAAPLFLFLAGVSVALAAASHVRKGKSVAEASWLVQKRGFQILCFAYLFRFQSFMLSPTASWHGLLKVDILNVMGVAMMATAWCWGRQHARAARTHGTSSSRANAIWLLGPAALCVLLSQFAPAWHWPELFGDRLQGYVRALPNAGNFAMLPWGAFVFAGAWLGNLVGTSRDAAAERAFYSRLGVGGAALIVIALAAGYLPTFTPYSTYWYSSSSFFVLRVGAMLAMMSLAWWWMQRSTASRWSPMIVFGRTSLFVYWIHVEIVYGFPTYPLRHELSIAGALVAYAIFTGVMLWLAIQWERTAKEPWIPARLRAA